MRRVTTPPRPLVLLAAVAAALVVLPLLGLLTDVPWSRLGEVLASDTARDALRLSLVTSVAAMLLAAVAVLPLPLQGQQVIRASGTVLPSVRHINSQDMSFGEMDPAAATLTDRVVSLLTTGVDAINGNAGTLDYRLNRNGQFSFSMPTSLGSTTSTATLAVDSWECGLMMGASPTAVTDPGSTADP